MYDFCKDCNGSGSGVIPDTDCSQCDGNGDAMTAIAKAIIIGLDSYGRSVDSVEYGLPVDPETKWLGTAHGKAMIEIVKNQFKRR